MEIVRFDNNYGVVTEEGRYSLAIFNPDTEDLMDFCIVNDEDFDSLDDWDSALAYALDLPEASGVEFLEAEDMFDWDDLLAGYLPKEEEDAY